MDKPTVGDYGIEFRKKMGPLSDWSGWEDCPHKGNLAEHIPALLNSPGTSIKRLAWKADYGTIFEYRRKGEK